MGRRKHPLKQIERGSLYFVDRRHDHFLVYHNIWSRQNSKNITKDNVQLFPVRSNGVVTTILVTTSEILFFGKKYVQVLVSNSSNDVTTGYMTQKEFLRVIAGKPQWVISH